MIALLRGVNVGGRAKLAMSDLRAAAESCGFERVQTYVQSGNVVFRTSVRSTAKVAAQLAAAIDATTDVSPAVFVRTRDELAAVVTGNPYAARTDDPTHLHVVFDEGTDPVLGRLDLSSYAPEEATAVGRELFLYLPGGIGRSKLAADLARRKGAQGTARNWRTVTTLLDLADELG
jgi:uncharacterized protein (DUF1697 family)